MGQTASVIALDRLRMTDVASVGGKNASLGEMISQLAEAGIRVPGGFATTADAYREFLKHEGLGERIAARLQSFDVDTQENPISLTDPNGNDPVIGATVGLIFGAVYGGLGAGATPNASIASVVAGIGAGGLVGLGVGALDPSLGIGTLGVIGGVAAGAGDVAGQVISNIFSGDSAGDINYGSTMGAVIGGFIGGVGGTVLGGLGEAAGLPEGLAVAMGTSISSGPGTLLPTVGGAIWHNIQNPCN